MYISSIITNNNKKMEVFMSKITNWKYTKPSYNPSVFDEFFDNNWYTSTFTKGFMKTDISKRKGNYVFDVDIPGYTKDDIQVKLDQGYLTIMVEKAPNSTVNDKDDDYEYLHQERYIGQYSRTFYVGCSDDAKANATYHNGVLTVVIPEFDDKQIDKTKYIPIN